MMNFRVGDKIKVIGGKDWVCGFDDIGREGVVVKVISSNSIAIDIPTSNTGRKHKDGVDYVWVVHKSDIQLLDPQLLFDFMYE